MRADGLADVRMYAAAGTMRFDWFDHEPLGDQGWMLVQGYHVGIHLAPEQEHAESTVQHTEPSEVLRRPAA
jgi:hypothetical protein